MLLVSGSWLVRDSGKRNDVDVVYLTWDIGKYIVLLMNKKRIESELGRKLGAEVSFSPYIIVSPTIIGNIFLAITLLRYPFRKPCTECILKLVLKRLSVRWLLLHFAFAVLGLLSASSLRDRIKYCSMVAENLLYIENVRIPNSWRSTIKIGYAVASKHKLHYISTLLSSCIKNIEDVQRYTLTLNTSSPQLVNIVKEYLKFIQVEDIEKLRGKVNDAFRRVHEVVMRHLLGCDMMWRACSSTIIALMHPKILDYITADPVIKTQAVKVFTLCRQQIPVLSPLAQP
jgi:hypothetical protein